eukprot:5690542-Prymnesium_polylepis.1
MDPGRSRVAPARMRRTCHPCKVRMQPVVMTVERRSRSSGKLPRKGRARRVLRAALSLSRAKTFQTSPEDEREMKSTLMNKCMKGGRADGSSIGRFSSASTIH